MATGPNILCNFTSTDCRKTSWSRLSLTLRASTRHRTGLITNYADWLLASFGRTFAELFPMQYTRKYHTTTADNMTTDWLGPRIYRPSLEEVLRGALSSSSPTVHYITHFRYPSEGGFVSYLNKFVPMGNLNLNHKLVSVDPRARQLRFSNGHEAHYDALVSSVPLPDLVRMIDGAPRDVLDAVGRLACSTCVVVNVGVNREDLSRAHVTYFYDEDICFARLGFPHMLAASNASPGTGSIQAEIYFSEKYKPFTGSPDDWIEPCPQGSPPLWLPPRGRPSLVHSRDVAPIRQYHLRPRPCRCT